MAPLLQLVWAGYQYGIPSHGWDSTVGSLECVLTNLDENKGNAFAASAYSENAIQYLEARLFCRLCHLQSGSHQGGQFDLAEEEYGRAVLLATPTVSAAV